MRHQTITWVAALATGLLSALPATAQDTRLVRMATGSPAGVYFPVGISLCRLVNEERPAHGVRCSAIRTEGSVANLALLEDGSVEFAIVQSDTQADAYEGTDGSAFDDLRSVMSLYPEPLTIAVGPDTGIADLAGLAGKRISVGPEGSGQRAIWDTIAAVFDWTPDSFAAFEELPAADQAQALCDGRIDAFVTAIGHPALTVLEAALSCGATLVPASGPQVDRILNENPSYFPATIPGDLYSNNPEPVATFGVGATVVTRADVPDEIVRLLVSSALADIGRLRGLDPALREIDPADMAEKGLTAPLHPGARAAYAAKGVLRD
jgi:uncharacterized protein